MTFCQSDSDFLSPTPTAALPPYSSDHIATFSKSQEPPPLYMETGTEEYQQQLQYPTTFTTSMDGNHAPSSSSDLQHILLYYQSQPDLLQLILESKLQEDRRRTEEARLRTKELDWLLLQQSLHQPIYSEELSVLATKRRRDSSFCSNTPDDMDQALLQQTSNNLPLDDTPPRELKPRKRREMQAITKLVETKDPEYLDGYFWRNNGNTTQKKTGNKSVYFKCSNSTKGCPVNKTSTYCHETGSYVIKYRGEHLIDCGKVQHIVEI